MSNLSQHNVQPGSGHSPDAAQPTAPPSAIEVRMAQVQAQLRAELDTHLSNELSRVVSVANNRSRIELEDFIVQSLDKKLTDVYNRLEADFEAKFKAIDGQLAQRLLDLEKKLTEQRSVSANDNMVDIPMVGTDPVDPDIIRQMKAKDDIISTLKSELQSYRHGVSPSAHQENNPLDYAGTPGIDQYDQPSIDQFDSQVANPRVKLGPRFPGVRELISDDPRFRWVVNYRRYRLSNMDQSRSAEVTAATGLNTRRLEHSFKKRLFDGSKPLAVISYLDHFKRECDMNNISEGAALYLLPKFLDGKAFLAYDANVSIGSEDLGGFSSYPAAVNFLLRTFASDTHIEAGVLLFEQLSQLDTESEDDFATRIREVARDTGGVYTQRELITRFQRGLKPELRPLLTRDAHEQRLTSLHEAAAAASCNEVSRCSCASRVSRGRSSGFSPRWNLVMSSRWV